MNHARSRYCQLCGVLVADATTVTGPSAVAGTAAEVGPRPVVGALVRADGVRVLLLDEVALSACPPPAMPSLVEAPTMVTARIVFLGWEPYALAETPGVRWAGPDGAPVPLEPGDSAPLLAGTQLVIGLDAYCYEPLDRVLPRRDPARPASKGRRRRRKLPDRSLFRPAD
jgi:hypothetical protein